MNTETTERPNRYNAEPGTGLPRNLGFHGWVALTWSVAGGVLLGGVLIAAMTLSGRLSAHGIFFTSTGLFVIGAILGFAHGAVLGYLGRPPDVSPRSAVQGIALGALYSIPALAVAWLATVWIAGTIMALYLGQLIPLAGVGVGWLFGLAGVVAAGALGFTALGNAYARWPQRRAGTLLTAAAFAALAAIFLADRPELWGQRLRLTETGAALLAVFATIWIAGPVITLSLRMVRDLPRRVEVIPSGWRAAGDGALGVVAGLVLALVVLPVAGPLGATGAAGSTIVAVSQALVNELLLRLFLVTGMIWVLLRWQRFHAEEAAVAAVVGSALVQVLLYLPGAAAIGFPTTLSAAAFLLAVVALPAAVFGALYWLRGFGSALAADATTLVAIALLA